MRTDWLQQRGDTLNQFGRHTRYLGGELGMTAVLHTWGQNLGRHVHVHCLVPGGVLIDTGDWHKTKNHYLFPVRALSRRYRGRRVSLLRASVNAGELHRVTNLDEIDHLLKGLMEQEWVVYTRHCLNPGDSVVDYLARYTHRIAISNGRLLSMEGERIALRYKGYRDDSLVSWALLRAPAAKTDIRGLVCRKRRQGTALCWIRKGQIPLSRIRNGFSPPRSAPVPRLLYP